MKKIKNLASARLFLFIAVLLAMLAVRQLFVENVNTGAAFGLFSRRAFLVIMAVLVEGSMDLALLLLTWTGLLARPIELFKAAYFRVPRWVTFTLFLALFAVLPIFILSGRVGTTLTGQAVRIWLLWIVIRWSSFLWMSFRRTDTLFTSVLGSGMLHGVFLQVLAFLPEIGSTPFALGWSEGSRFYNASLFWAQSIYGISLPLPILHPTRYLMQATAFILPSATILFHRTWQVLLWLGCNGFTAWALARRLKLPRWQTWLTGAWAFLFFFQGPIYYHVVLCAGFVLLLFDRQRPFRSLLVVIVASIWAGLSRINWYPVPGVLVALLFLLEEQRGHRSMLRYLVWPAVWVSTGLATAFAANAVYVALSGNPPEVFGSALSSPLLWYRLFPNITYAPGILQGSVLAFLPLVAFVLLKLALSRARWNWLRWLGLVAVLIAFFGAGLVVSVKVGGGSNLHNLDNFIILLVVIATYAFFDRFIPDQTGQTGGSHWMTAFLLVVMFLPILQPLSKLYPPPDQLRTPAEESALLVKLQRMLDSVQGNGPVLFISDRQLLTFKNLKADQFESEYEKVFLMEMAMSGNPLYLGRFARDLQDHKFPLIISEPLNANIQDQTRAFSEENNLWVERVEYPILENYRLLRGFEKFGLYVYIPK
jgi:hypothetical protein